MSKQKIVPFHWVISTQSLLFEAGILRKEKNTQLGKNEKYKPGHFHSMISNWKTNERN